MGVEEINSLGKKFDPNLHEAVSQEASKDKPEGTVLKVMRRGFKLKDRLLRPAMVVVSSGRATS
jgi:molecular chaperone GrpE